LPDGKFLNQKCKFWHIWEGLGVEYCGIFCDHFLIFLGHLVYLMAFRNILWSVSYIFFHSGLIYQEKSGNPGAYCRFRIRHYFIVYSKVNNSKHPKC
jgi:hypothetical protein